MLKMKQLFLGAAFFVAASMWPTTTAAQFTLSPETPVIGETVTITLPEAADVLTVTYRPNSSVPRIEEIATNGLTTVSWTPTNAGVVALAAGSASMNTSVRYQSAPMGGIFVLIVAGLILFGGAIFAFRLLFQDDDLSIDEVARRPDT